jgi:hypothetical protein
MTEQEFMIVIYGGLIAAFGIFASYMDYRQKERESREAQADQGTH